MLDQRENFLIDEIGPRRFTHNELASLKGLPNYNYNSQSNKMRMYNKIAYETNVYVVQAIANAINNYLCCALQKHMHKDYEESSKKVIEKNRKRG